MITTPELMRASLLHLEDIGWEDLDHLEAPQLAHRTLNFAWQDILYLRQSFKLSLQCDDLLRRIAFDMDHLRAQQRQWLLEEIQYGRIYLRVEKPVAPVARWRVDPKLPLGGEWQKDDHRELGMVPLGVMGLHQRIDALTRLKLLARQSIQKKVVEQEQISQIAKLSSPIDSGEDEEEHDEQFHLVGEDGETPLANRKYIIRGDNGLQWTGVTDEEGLTIRVKTVGPVNLTLEIFSELI